MKTSQSVLVRKSLVVISAVSVIFIAGCKKNSSVRPERKDVIETVYASGTIIPQNEYSLYSLVSGTIEKKFVSDGDSVRKDQVIYSVSNDAPRARLEAAQEGYQASQENISKNSSILADLKLAVQSAESKFRNDSLQYLRMKNLFDGGAINKEQLDNASLSLTVSRNSKGSAEERYYSTLHELRAASSNAKSQAAVAASDLHNFLIRSESNGVVYQTFKELGETVRMGELAATVGDRDARTIRLAVDQQDIDKIQVGEQVLLKADITGSKIYEAKVTKVYPVMNPADQTFRVDAEFTSASPTQFVHSSVEANIVIRKKDHALVIPRAYLISGDSVRIHSAGGDKTISVKTGIVTLDDAEIISGIDEHSEILEPNSH